MILFRKCNWGLLKAEHQKKQKKKGWMVICLATFFRKKKINMWYTLIQMHDHTVKGRERRWWRECWGGGGKRYLFKTDLFSIVFDRNMRYTNTDTFCECYTNSKAKRWSYLIYVHGSHDGYHFVGKLSQTITLLCFRPLLFGL